MKQANESFAGPKNQKGFLNAEENIRTLEETKQEVIRFTAELDARLANKEVNGIEYHLLLHEKLQGKSKEEVLEFIDQRIAAENSMIFSRATEHSNKKKKMITFGAAAIILVFIAVISIFNPSPGSLTGYTTATKDIPDVISYNQLFDHYTETQLDLTNLTSLKITGVLEGTGAKVKLRINGTDYLVANIINPANAPDQITGMVTKDKKPSEPNYTLTSDKASYALGETVALAVAPDAENTSFYVTIGEQTQKLDDKTFVTQSVGEHQAVAIIVLPKDMLRLEANFTVIEASANGTPTEPPVITNGTNETNQTNQTNETNTTEIPEIPPETPTGYQFTSLCLDTCNLAQASNPILIVEPDDNSTLTISIIEIVQTKENQAPVQSKNMPDVILVLGQPLTIDLNDYFTDPDGDTIQYDLNAIPEVSVVIQQQALTLTSETLGAYVAYIYATDGNQLTTSNTFMITVETGTTPSGIGNETNQTNETNATAPEFVQAETAGCNDPVLNNRPAYCFAGMEEKVFQDLSAPLSNNNGEMLGRFNKFGNLIIKGLLVENTGGSPGPDDFTIGFSERKDFEDVRTYTAWISKETGNLNLRGRIYEEQDVVKAPQFNTYIIQNKLGIILAYFNELTGDLYIKGNLVQLGKI